MKQCLDINARFVARYCLTEDRQAEARLSAELKALRGFIGHSIK